MNLKVKLPTFSKKFLVAIILVNFFWVIFLYVILSLDRKEKIISNISEASNNITLNQVEQASIRENTFEELSPDGQKRIIRYEVNYLPKLFSENYTTYLDNKIVIAVINNIGDVEREYFVFNGEERTGDPHWLGNRYVFFTAYCGTACQRLTLLDTQSKQTWEAMISYWSRENDKQKTHFRNWFGQGFEFFGFIDKIYAEMDNNKPYLVFDISNDSGVESGQKRFLFTGDSLTLQ